MNVFNKHYEEENMKYINIFIKEITEMISKELENTIETLIKNNCAEVLTDEAGKFSYRLTELGRDIYEAETGLPSPINDIYLK